MRRFRRRRARPIWFPPLGSNLTVGEDQTQFGGVTFQIDVLATGAITFTEVPLTFDFGQEAILADAQNPDRIPSLADLTSSSWRLRRAVGKFFAAYHITNTGVLDGQENSYPACALAAGLMVRKVTEFGTAATNVDPWNQDDYDDPWIWRRVWILGQDVRYTRNQDTGGGIRKDSLPATLLAAVPGLDAFASFARFPNTTAHYAGALDGSHVDAKTNRIIGPEDRLMLSIAAKGLPIIPDLTITQNNRVFGMFDFRYLGYPMRSTNRRNASR